MAPHTCECKICGFQWKRSDEEFSGDTDTRATVMVGLNKPEVVRRNRRGVETDISFPTKFSSSKKACDAPLHKVAAVDKNGEPVGEEQKLTHNAGGKNEREITVTNTTNKKWVDTGNAFVITRSKGSLVQSKLADREDNHAKIIEANENNNWTKSTDREETKRSAVKEVTAMLDDTLVIPERDIINSELDDIEKSTTTYPTVEQGFYSYAEHTERKTYDEKENINMKQKCKLEGHSRATSGKCHPGRSPIPHNMPGNNYTLPDDDIKFNLAKNSHQHSINYERSMTVSRNSNWFNLGCI